MLFAAALIPGLLIGAILSYGIYQNERSRLEQGALQTARALLQAIDSELIKARDLTLSLSKSEYLLTRNFAGFYRQASEVIKVTGTGHNYVLSDTNGQQLLNTAVPYSNSLPKHAKPEQIDRVLATQRPAISDLFIGAALGRPLFTVDIPVVLDGKITYILSIVLLPEHFNGLLADQNMPGGWIATVLDSGDTVVARSLNPEESVGRKASSDLRAQLRKFTEGTIASHSLEGSPTFIAFAHSHSSHWTVAVGMARSVLYSNLYPLIALVIFSILILLISGVVLVLFFSRYVRHSLEALGVATEAATLGDREALAPTTGPLEIARLAEQFNLMQEARRQMEEQIRQLAFSDALTKLANRHYLYDRLSQALAISKRKRCYGALLFLDLDNFKPLNDTHGHAAGDLLLIEVANRLRGLMREVDTVARFGGDEFVVLINELNRDEPESRVQVRHIAEKILLSLSEDYELSVSHEDSSPSVIKHHCTATIGVTLFINNNGLNSDDVLKRADIALYQGKRSGRNVITFDFESEKPSISASTG